MSISYVTTEPMTLDQAIHLLKAFGCTVEETEDHYATVKDPNGNYFHLTDDIGSYRTLSFDLSSETMTIAPAEIHDGTTRVMGECYNVNDATRMAAVLGMVSEHDDEYHDIMGEEDEEEDEEA